MKKNFSAISELPKQVPLFPLNGALLLPRTELPLNVFEPRYIAMIEHAMAGDRIIAIIQPDETADSKKPKLQPVGCIGRITSYTELQDRYLITLQGICRFNLRSESRVETVFRQGKPNYAPFKDDLKIGFAADTVNRQQLIEAFRQFLEANNMSANWEEVNAVNTELLVNSLALMSPFGAAEKQALLCAHTLKTRAEMLVAFTELALKKSIFGNSTRMQ